MNQLNWLQKEQVSSGEGGVSPPCGNLRGGKCEGREPGRAGANHRPWVSMQKVQLRFDSPYFE